MKTLARLGVRHRWYVLFAWIAIFLGTNLAAQSLGSSYADSFTLPGTNSSHAYDLLKTVHGQSGDVDQIVLQARSGTLASHRSSIEAMLARVASLPDVASVASPFCASPGTSCPGAAQVSRDGTIAYAVVTFALPGYQLSNAQVQRVESVGSTIRSSKPSKREESSASAGCRANSSTSSGVSWRPFGVSAITGMSGSAP